MRIVLSAVVFLLLAFLGQRWLGISWSEVWGDLSRFSWIHLVSALGFCTLQLIFLVGRVTAIVPANRMPPLSRLFYANWVGMFLNTFLPARTGDLARATLLSRQGKDKALSFLCSVGVLLADRVIDIPALVSLFVLTGGIRWVPLPHVRLENTLLAAGVIALVIVLGWGLKQWLKKMWDKIQAFREGFSALRRPQRILIAYLFAIASWLSEAAALMVLCHGQGIDLSIPQTMFILFSLNLAISVPVSIANVGPFEAGIVLALQSVGQAAAPALAVATAHHIIEIAATAVCAASSSLFYFVFGEGSLQVPKAHSTAP